jgi:hypothetical protein
MTDSPENDVGYRRPPTSTRFKKGQSGNPRGRPKATASFRSDLIAELQEKLVVTENGREKRITKQRAFIKTLTAAAIKKDIRAVNALLACMRLFGATDDEPTDNNADPGDLEFLEGYLARQRKKPEPSTAGDPRTKSRNNKST